MTNVNILYLQEFTMEGQNPICRETNYSKKVYEVFQGLKALDGYRKSVPMNFNMQEAMPIDEDEDFDYNTDQV